jgi:hypothetical protein
LVGLDYRRPGDGGITVLGIALIGMVNLLVSFGLALWVALRARKVRLRNGFGLLRALGRRLRAAPLDFFIGPRDVEQLIARSAQPKRTQMNKLFRMLGKPRWRRLLGARHVGAILPASRCRTSEPSWRAAEGHADRRHRQWHAAPKQGLGPAGAALGECHARPEGAGGAGGTGDRRAPHRRQQGDAAVRRPGHHARDDRGGARATTSINLETYIFDQDEIGLRVRRRC